MNFLFSQKEKTQYEIIKEILGQKLFSIASKDTYLVNANDIVKCKIKPYWGQRATDEIHINTIAQGIVNSNHLFHPIILANIIPRENVSILDGQHRYEALQRISETQRSRMKVQVDVINFEIDDDKWILTQYEWINTSKSMNKIELKQENEISMLVDELSKHFGSIGGGYRKIDDFALKNKQNSKVIKSDLKKELLKRVNKLDGDVKKKIIDYNEDCCVNYEVKFKGFRIGKNVKEECILRKFWLGINFPNWLDDVLN
jgi:hypothetical protein